MEHESQKIVMSIIADKLHVNPLWLMGYDVNKDAVYLKKKNFTLITMINWLLMHTAITPKCNQRLIHC